VHAIAERPIEDDHNRAFLHEQPRLAGLAYRILGSRADADDVVQEAWIRWQRSDPATIERPGAWLTTVTSRLALDRLTSAQRTRETYVGPWLPEPVVESQIGDPADVVELQESLTMGFLVLLERLAPVERVVFLLADVFGVPFDDIATTVDRTPVACRQIASRARQRVRAGRPRFQPTDDEAWAAAAAFFAAASAGDIDGLVSVLSDDVVLVSDGGANRHAARRPVVGPARVARFVATVTARMPADVEIEPALVNGEPGVLVRSLGSTLIVLGVHVDHGRIDRLHAIVNPDKLASVGHRSADLR